MATAADPQEIIKARDAEIEKINGFADLTQEAKDRRIKISTTPSASSTRRYART
jgi:hypothetical protein